MVTAKAVGAHASGEGEIAPAARTATEQAAVLLVGAEQLYEQVDTAVCGIAATKVVERKGGAMSAVWSGVIELAGITMSQEPENQSDALIQLAVAANYIGIIVDSIEEGAVRNLASGVEATIHNAVSDLATRLTVAAEVKPIIAEALRVITLPVDDGEERTRS